LSSMHEQEEKELIRKTLRGDKRAFEMIVRKYQQPLLNYIGRMVGERELALDFTQEVFVRAYASLRSFEPRFKLSTWLYRIASNLVIDYWRKKKIPTFSLSAPLSTERGDLTMDVPDEEPSVARTFELVELGRRIEGVLDQIPASFRQLFIWRHISGLSYEEMAEITDLPVGTVKNRVFQAKEMIRRLLEKKP
jgi:RNA polymerase sigma-70 factor (ECF subfamily)